MTSYPTRSLSVSGPQSAALLQRIQEKRTELDNLKQLRDLSATMATQMENLGEKLSTLRDGTEAVATVVGNWDNVLQAIHMASMALVRPPQSQQTRTNAADEEEEEGEGDGGGRGKDAGSMPLPETLVRIPTEHAPTMQAHAEGAAAAEEARRESA